MTEEGLQTFVHSCGERILTTPGVATGCPRCGVMFMPELAPRQPSLKLYALRDGTLGTLRRRLDERVADIPDGELVELIEESQTFIVAAQAELRRRRWPGGKW